MLYMHSTSSSYARRLAPLGVLGFESLAVVLLHRLGSVSSLRLPSPTRGAWRAWLTFGNPADVLAALVRVGALAAAWWLLVSTLLYTLAAARGPGAARVAGVFTPALVRRLVDGMLAVSLAGALAGGRSGVAWARDPALPPAGRAAAAAASGSESPTEDAVVLPADVGRGIVFPPGTGVVAPTPVPSSPAAAHVVSGGTLAPVATLPDSPLPVIPPSPSEAAVVPPKATAGPQAPEPSEAGGLPGVPPPAGGARDDAAVCQPGVHDKRAAAPSVPGEAGGEQQQDPVRIVRPGESLWSIAAGHVDAGEPARVGPYWLRVVEANRRTIRSGDPDRIRPGESVTLPPLTERDP
jgi:hypothetical protein